MLVIISNLGHTEAILVILVVVEQSLHVLLLGLCRPPPGLGTLDVLQQPPMTPEVSEHSLRSLGVGGQGADGVLSPAGNGLGHLKTR